MSQEHDRTVTATPTESKPAPVVHGTPVVFVVDEDASVRESLEALIQCAGWHAETFARAHEFFARTRVAVPGCLVLDVTLPDLDGLAIQKRIAGDPTELPIIFITGRGDVPMAVRAMKAGAVEFLQKPLGDDVVLNAIGEAIGRSHAALERQADVRALRDRYAALSPRERAVLTLVVSGRLNKQIGAELGISEITVKAHRGRVMRKMQADSLADLVRMAATLGIALVARAPDRLRTEVEAAIARGLSETETVQAVAMTEYSGSRILPWMHGRRATGRLGVSEPRPVVDAARSRGSSPTRVPTAAS